MPLELRLLTGLAMAVAVVYAATPLAIRVANRLEFYDHPVGYKVHGSPTPYLGGTAVVTGFVVAVVALAGHWERTIPLLAGVVAMWGVGTWDDRRTVTPAVRIALEVALGAGLWWLGLGWELGVGALVDLAVTAFWIVAVVNAFNLFDNMDGATPAMGSVAAAGLATLGVAQGNTWLAVTAAALCGACAGFLPHNLSSPARIFLGDGGSMPIGFAVAALAMIGVSESAVEWQSLAMGLLFVGVPALDTALVMISRRRRGISLLTGGRDHLTHRTHQRLLTARAVALALGSAQATVSALAIVALEGGSSTIVAAVAIYLIGAGVAIAMLDTRWAPAETPLAAAGLAPAARRMRMRRHNLSIAAVVVLAAAIGASPYFDGYYHASVWLPAGLALVVGLTAGVIGRPPRIGPPALLLLAGLGGLAAMSVASGRWADSVGQAVTAGNRLLAYLALVGVLLVLVRTERAAIWLMGALAAIALGEGLVTIARLLGENPADLLVAGRLNAPLGYINGQAAFHLLGAWCLLAIAEQRRSSLLAGAGLAGAALLAALLLVSQSRGALIAALASVVVVVAVVPGRARRAWALAFLVAAVAAASPWLLELYQQGRGGALPASAGHRAGLAALLAAAAAGALWGGAAALVPRSGRRAGGLRLAIAAVPVAAVVAALAVAVVEREAIGRELDRQYTAFTAVGAGDAARQGGATRLASGAGNRYDYWRIAVGAWRDHPLLGVGAGNYDGRYFRERATTEDVRQPHSLLLQTLSELGLLGAALLALLLAGLAWGASNTVAAARRSEAVRFQAVAALGCVTAWLVHTSVDWLHLLPGITAIALAAAAVLVRERAPMPVTAAVRPASRRRLVVAVGVATALALAGLSLSRSGLAEYFRSQAQEALAAEPERALRLADRSLRLDRDGIAAYYVKSAAFARFGEADAARAALREAARREPGDFVTWALLGDVATRAGDEPAAERAYRRALALNPRDPGLQRQLAELADR